MRVLLVSYRFPPDAVGGLERYTQSLAAELVRAGHEVAIVARRTEPGQSHIRLIRERLKDGTSLYRIVGPDIRFDRFLENHERFDELFRMAWLESKPEIVHVNHIMGFSPRIVQASHQLGSAVVLSLHDFYFACPRIHLRQVTDQVCAGPDFGNRCAVTCFTSAVPDRNVWGLRAMYFSRTLASAEAVIAYSHHVASYFGNFSPTKRPIHVVSNAVPPELQPNGDSSNGRGPSIFSIAYCGTLARHKGPHVIVEALKIARLKSVNLFLIGHAPERDYLRTLRAQAATVPGLDLKLYGKYERSELPFLLSGIDCVVVPSLVPEAGPIVPREALACGVPVLAARLGALPEVIAEGENGFTFDPAKPEALAVLLQRMASDPSLVQRLRAGARRSPQMTLAEHGARIHDIYCRALQEFESNTINRQEASELKVLHSSLLRLGCDLANVCATSGR